MQQYEAIEKRIENQDIEGLRRAVGSICYTSRDFSSGEFLEAIKYIESRGIALKVDGLVGDLVSKEKSSFTDEDFGQAVFELGENFCEERIQDVMKIGKALYGTKMSEEKEQMDLSGKVKRDEHKENLQTDRERSPKEESRQGRNMGILAAIAIVIILILIKIFR